MRITFVLPTADIGGGIRVVATYARLLAKKGTLSRLLSQPPKRFPCVESSSVANLDAAGLNRPAAEERDPISGPRLDHRVLDRRRPVTDDDIPDGDVVVATWWETAEWVNALSANKGAKVYFIQGHEIFPHLPVDRSRATYRLPLHKIVIALG